MSYATMDDMIARWGHAELVDTNQNPDAPRGTLDEARITTALSDASSVMDSYFQRRYVLPVRPVTSALVRVCCVLARFNLAQGTSTVPSEQMANDRKAAMNWLNDIATGRATLDAQVLNESSGDWSSISTRPADIGREYLL